MRGVFRTPVREQIRSKGFLAGWGLIGLGVFLMVERAEYGSGIQVLLFGLGILGLRDKLGEGQ